MPLKTREPQPRTTVTIHQQPPAGSSSQSNSLEESDYISDSLDDHGGTESQLWDDDDDLLPSDSASTTEGPPYPYYGAPRRSHQRIVPLPDWRDQHHPGPSHTPHVPHAPHAPPNVERDGDFGAHWGRGYPPQHHQVQRGFYNGGGGRGLAQAYHANPSYGMGAYGGHGSMVPFAQQQYNNAFGGPGAGYFNGDGRSSYDMMHYNQGFYGDPRQYSMPTHMQQYQMTAPVPAPTEHPGQSVTPAAKEPPPPDPEKLRLEAELAAFKAQQEKAKAEAEQKEKEAQIRKDAEESFHKRMEDMRRAQEEAQKEIAKAKEEAERAAKERMEAERQANEERARQHAEAMERAEQNARLKFEADQKAAEEKRKQEEEAARRAEEAARIRVEAAIKAENEAKAAAEKKAAEEIERIKKIEEDAKRKAEADAAAKVEKEKADAAAAAEAAEAAKKEQEELKKKWQDEAAQKATEAAQKPTDQAPIKFSDAVGRKFSFPFHLCKTWTGMEELIKQAFLQVDVLGPHVQEGHYDLIGPNGEIILPSVWEKVVQPDWSIKMTMWPVEKSPPLPGPRMAGIPGRHGGVPAMGARGAGAPGAHRPPIPPSGIPPPPMWHNGRRGAPHPAGIQVVNAAPSKPKKHKKDDTFLKFLTGSKPAKKKGKK